MDDFVVECLTYGRRLATWHKQAEAQESDIRRTVAAWPAIPITILRLKGTKVTKHCIQFLLDLASLSFLDLRHTGIAGPKLIPLERRFGLRQVQGAVLSSSNALASQCVVQKAVACVCKSKDLSDSNDEWADWSRNGAKELLLYATDLP